MDIIVLRGVQGLDRYAGMANNPVKYVDPSGHYVCEDADRCAGPENTTPKLPPLVRFTDAGWNDKDKAAVEMVASSVANAYARTINRNFLLQKRQGEIDRFRRVSPIQAFLTIHGGPVTFTRVTNSCKEGCAARTTGRNNITIYSNATWSYIVNHYRVISHELGHAFNIATGRLAQNVPNNLLRPMNGEGVIDWGEPGNDFYGYAGGFEDWQFGYSSSIPGSEEFADMFVGWTYGRWGSENDATDRQHFMNNQMSIFLFIWDWDK